MSDEALNVSTLRIEVQEADAGKRLDKVVVSAFESRLGRSGARALFEHGAVRVDGRVARKGDQARAGSVITVASDVPLDDAAVAQPGLELDVRLEREDVVVVCKPAGMPTAPLRGGEIGTLVNALVARYPEMRAFGHSRREPGIVHRLDTDTSGLLIAARTAEAFEELVSALRAEQIHKGYLLLCDDTDLADSGVVEIPLCPHPKDTRRVLACVHPRDQARYSPRPASTSYRVLERAQGVALVEATAPKAARHQIRAHMAAIGHPLLGDALYGGESARLSRHALHAYHVVWRGSASVPAFEVRDEVPQSFRALLGADARG